MEPQIRFCTSADGTRIAYATVGEGPPLVHVNGWGSNIELDWQTLGRAWFEDLARGRRVVWFDRRGTGASQRDVRDFSLEAHVADLAAIVDHLRFERFDLFGSYDGAAVSIAYAAQNPQRVDRLALQGPYGSGGDTIQPEALRSTIELIHGNWGMARRAIADAALPNGPIELQKLQSRVFRESMSPEVAAEYMEFQGTVDVRQYLSKVEAPTLVLARRGARVVPISAARVAAAVIPDSRFIALEGDVTDGYFDHEQFVTPIREFLDEGRVQAPTAEPRTGGLVTILLTDMEGSTDLTQRLGDAGAQDCLRTHNTIVRDALGAQGGSEIKHTGDGIMASFASASSSLKAAIAIQKAFANHNQDSAHTTIRVRIGLNAGEPVAEDDDLFGTAVQLAARVCAQAEPGQILTSNVVQELAAGKGFDFADQGEAELKGFEKPVRLHEVRWE